MFLLALRLTKTHISFNLFNQSWQRINCLKFLPNSQNVKLVLIMQHDL